MLCLLTPCFCCLRCCWRFRGRPLAPIRPSNAAGAATASRSVGTQGEGSSLHTTPLPPLQRCRGTSPAASASVDHRTARTVRVPLICAVVMKSLDRYFNVVVSSLVHSLHCKKAYNPSVTHRCSSRCYYETQKDASAPVPKRWE
jgi:hypothetical protein